MVTVKTYVVPEDGTSIDTSGIVSANVIVVDRNGIGVKHQTNFLSTPVEVDITAYQWYGIKQTTAPLLGYFLKMSEVVGTSDRTYVYLFGPSPRVGDVYAVYYGSIIAKYRVQTGDGATAVRDGLKAAIDAKSWGVTITTTNIGVNSLQVVVSDTITTLTNITGVEKYKNGYITYLSGDLFIVFEQESTTAQPSLPALAASYDYDDLKYSPSPIATYLQEPVVVSSLTQSVAGQSDILGIAQDGNVPPNECVVYQPGQKIYFNLPLLAGEIINVISK